tara:strand:+ start:328 stop:543 length:216 start_codon:yes stop_codon:yes gene_type:complete
MNLKFYSGQLCLTVRSLFKEATVKMMATSMAVDLEGALGAGIETPGSGLSSRAYSVRSSVNISIESLVVPA